MPDLSQLIIDYLAVIFLVGLFMLATDNEEGGPDGFA